MSDAIRVEGLTKTYPRGKGNPPLTAVDGIDFTVQEGEVFGKIVETFEAALLGGCQRALRVARKEIVFLRAECFERWHVRSPSYKQRTTRAVFLPIQATE